MSMTVLIGLEATAWALVAGLVALVIARITRMRDLQRPGSSIPDRGVEIGSAHAAEWCPPLMPLLRSL